MPRRLPTAVRAPSLLVLCADKRLHGREQRLIAHYTSRDGVEPYVERRAGACLYFARNDYRDVFIRSVRALLKVVSEVHFENHLNCAAYREEYGEERHGSLFLDPSLEEALHLGDLRDAGQALANGTPKINGRQREITVSTHLYDLTVTAVKSLGQYKTTSVGPYAATLLA